MIDLKSMTKYQRVLTGLRIFAEYLSPKDNPGDVTSTVDQLRVDGVHREALGGDDRATLEAMGWRWAAAREQWVFDL